MTGPQAMVFLTPELLPWGNQGALQWYVDLIVLVSPSKWKGSPQATWSNSLLKAEWILAQENLPWLYQSQAKISPSHSEQSGASQKATHFLALLSYTTSALSLPPWQKHPEGDSCSLKAGYLTWASEGFSLPQQNKCFSKWIVCHFSPLIIELAAYLTPQRKAPFPGSGVST